MCFAVTFFVRVYCDVRSASAMRPIVKLLWLLVMCHYACWKACIGAWPRRLLKIIGIATMWYVIFIRLEAIASAEYWIHFGTRSDGVHALGYNSAESEAVWMKSGTLWVHCLGLALTNFGHDPRSSEIWRARRNFVFFGQVNNAGFYPFPVGQISLRLNTTRLSVCDECLGTKFWKFSRNCIVPKSLYGMPSSHFYRLNQFKVIPLACTLRTRSHPNSLQRHTPVHDTPCVTCMVAIGWLLS